MPEVSDTAALPPGSDEAPPRPVLSGAFWALMLLAALCLLGSAVAALSLGFAGSHAFAPRAGLSVPAAPHSAPAR